MLRCDEGVVIVVRGRDPEGRFVIAGVGVTAMEARGFDDGGPIVPIDGVATAEPLMRTLLPRADTPLPIVTEDGVSDGLLFLRFSVSDIADGGRGVDKTDESRR